MAHFFTLHIPSLFESSWCSTRFIGWRMWRAIKSVGRSVGRWPSQDWGSMVMNVHTSWLHPNLLIAWFMNSGIDEFVLSLISYVQLLMNVPLFRFPAIYPFGMWLQMLSDLAMSPKYCNFLLRISDTNLWLGFDSSAETLVLCSVQLTTYGVIMMLIVCVEDNSKSCERF